MSGAIKVHPADNVAVAVRELHPNDVVLEGVRAAGEIPACHKAALTAIRAGEPVVRYGVAIGVAARDIAAGEWVSERDLAGVASPTLDRLTHGTPSPGNRPIPARRTFMGYRNRQGFAGTRNLLAISTSVQCVAGVVNAAVERARRELLTAYPAVDDIVPLNHAYGCGVAIDARDAENPIRAIRNLMRNPNFGGEVLLVALGCEKLTPERLLTPEETAGDALLVLQDYDGYEAMMAALLRGIQTRLERLNTRRREELPLSDLIIGTQCGGSDAFSGLSCNPAVGVASDMLVAAGATVLFSETTEVRDAVTQLAERVCDETTMSRLACEMRWYDRYLEEGGVGRDANPTPGNKAGGLSSIVEKAMGSVAKSGTTEIAQVLSPAERPLRRGLIYAATPASDFVCGTCQLASGITLQVFTTGRGTPYGLAAAPVIKVSSGSDLAARWFDLIDVDAGRVLTGGDTIPALGERLYDLILDVASGQKTCAERLRIHNDLCVFNPAPIT